LRRGKVYLVGAGPGDPELITLKAKRLLYEADVVLFDRLANIEVLEGLPASTEQIDVGKLPGRHRLTQEEINRLLVEKGRGGKIVVRLKGGDPYLFGRGGEEGLALAEAGVPFEVVPGVTSAISVPARMGIPVTHRSVSTAVTIVTGHEEPGKEKNLDWGVLARMDGTLVILMGVSRLEDNVSALIKGGKNPETPAALIEKGGSCEERLVTGTLETIARVAEEEEVKAPAILVVGDVVNLSRDLRPLTIAILRPENRSEESARLARACGLRPLLAPAIAFEQLPLPDDMTARIEGAGCVVFTSATGAEIALQDRKVAENLCKTNLAAIGPRTKEALEDLGLTVSVVPDVFSSEGLADALIRRFERVLLLRSAKGSPVLVEMLEKAGVEVDEIQLYDITPSNDPRLDRLIKQERPDIFAFTSGSTSRYLMERARELGLEGSLRMKLEQARVVAIGPPTKAELDRLDVRVDAMPERYTFGAMLETLGRK